MFSSKQDLVVANSGSNSVSVLINTTPRGAGTGPAEGSSHVVAPASIAFGAGLRPGAVVVGDFDGDGRLDVAVANTASNHVSVLINDTAYGQWRAH